MFKDVTKLKKCMFGCKQGLEAVGVESENVSLTQDKRDEVCKEIENRGIKVNKTNNDKEDDDLVQPTLEVEVTGTEDLNGMKETGDKRKKSYASADNVGSHKDFSKKLFEIPTETDEYGFKDIVDVSNGVFFIKFHNDEGLESVVNSGPWMVRVCNVPLEAWATNGISALASRIGKPLVMDNVTAEMCKVRFSRVRFARVLVEVSAKKSLPNEIEIVYRDKNKMELCRKIVQAKYDWVPSRCLECCVFGHNEGLCKKNKPAENHVVDNDETIKDQRNDARKNSEKNGFIEVNNRKFNGVRNRYKNNNRNHKQLQNQGMGVQKDKPESQIMFQRKEKEALDVSSKEATSVSSTPNISPIKNVEVQSDSPNGSSSRGKVWSVYKHVLNDIRKSANKYFILEELDDDHNLAEVNDVYADENGIEFKIGCWNIRGLSTSEKQTEVRKFISDESLSMCAVIETQLKAKNLQKIGDFVFKSWSWIENKRYCDKGCRIMVGWNSDFVNMNIVHYCKQSVLCKLEAIKGDLFMFYTIIYAANEGSGRMEFWKDQRQYKRVVGNNVYAIMGDMNVTLDPKEHSVGSSFIFKDMNDFKECVNDIEVEDVTSSGLFFTWTKILYKTKSGDNPGVLKKLDRAIGNEILICKHPQTHAIFLPYLISDYYHVVLVIPNSVHARKKAFRFSNFVANIKEFKDEVAKSKIDVDPSNKVLREEESSILLMYNAAMCDEEQLLFQKAKIKWLSVGDKNNKFFHRVVKSRNHKNRVNAIHDEDGSGFEGGHVAAQFVKYFQNFLGKNVLVCKIDDMGVLFKNKLGPDEADVVKEFFLTGKILNEINSTNIALVQNLLVIRRIENCSGFQYHFGCSKLKITHVCFADDLLMFSHGDKESVRIMKDSTKEFGKVSGLLPNYNKSTIVFGSVKEKDRRDILEVVPFKVEKLLVKYIGVPDKRV
ncbi:RNA-directed DNA polymerase, eukaryota, reverse transcriptase zinc-binding domain protein [Tanacetum coccineum]